MANVFGKISQNNSNSNVIIQVEIHIARFCSIPDPVAISRLIFVAKEAVNTFTRLFPINMVIRSFSFLSLIFFRILAQDFFCFMRESILCAGSDIKASSLPEKNADKANNKANNNIEATSSIWIKMFELIKYSFFLKKSRDKSTHY